MIEIGSGLWGYKTPEEMKNELECNFECKGLDFTKRERK